LAVIQIASEESVECHKPPKSLGRQRGTSAAMPSLVLQWFLGCWGWLGSRTTVRAMGD